jgi:LysM repeat protein
MQQFEPASLGGSNTSSAKSSERFQRAQGLLAAALLIVVLTACSRQAEGPFVPADGSTPTPQPTLVSQSIPGDTSGTLPPLPTEDAGSESELDNSTLVIESPAPDETEQVAIFTLDPNAPPIFTLAASATWTPDPNGGLATEEVTATLSGDFITPGAPQGPVDLSGAGSTTGLDGTAEVGSGAGDLLPTPTNLIDFGDSETADVDEECIYVVQRGDSLFSISLDLEVSLDDLRAINPEVQDTDVIQIDQELIIPNCDEDFIPSTDEADSEIDAPEGDATMLPTPGGLPTATSAATTGRTHTVAAGETLFIIAQEYDVTIDAIVEANNLSNPNSLDVDQILIIPDSE